MRNEWTRTEQENFAKDTNYSTKSTELILAVFFSYQYSNAMYKKYEMIIFNFLLLKRHRTSLEIRDTKTNYHNHFKLFISHGK